MSDSAKKLPEPAHKVGGVRLPVPYKPKKGESDEVTTTNDEKQEVVESMDDLVAVGKSSGDSEGIEAAKHARKDQKTVASTFHAQNNSAHNNKHAGKNDKVRKGGNIGQIGGAQACNNHLG